MRKGIFLFILLFISSYISFSQAIPKQIGVVSDYENVFTPEQNAILTKMLTDYENETSIEIAILTVPDFESDIADFAQKTATEWKLGKKDINNGLLIILSKNIKILRSQTGYGLEGYLPDGWLKHTGDSIGVKYFAMNNYYEGVYTFVNQCQERIGKEGYSEDHNKELAEKKKESNEEKSILSWMLENIPWYYWVGIIVGWLLLLIVWPDAALFLLYLVISGGKGGGGSKGGGSFGGGGSSSKW